jgi:predicted  nucleic acid-binding Zn-ribbon protein
VNDQKNSMVSTRKNLRNDRLLDLQKNNAYLQNTIESLESQLKTSEERINDLKYDLEKQKESNSEISSKIVGLEEEAKEKEEMKETLKEVRGQKKRLEVHLDKLLQSPFVKQHEESKKNQQRFMDLNQ